MDIKIRLIHEAWWAVENESVKKLFLSVILEYSKKDRSGPTWKGDCWQDEWEAHKINVAYIDMFFFFKSFSCLVKLGCLVQLLLATENTGNTNQIYEILKMFVIGSDSHKQRVFFFQFFGFKRLVIFFQIYS